jgi:hypothetical protein
VEREVTGWAEEKECPRKSPKPKENLPLFALTLLEISANLRLTWSPQLV